MKIDALIEYLFLPIQILLKNEESDSLFVYFV